MSTESIGKGVTWNIDDIPLRVIEVLGRGNGGLKGLALKLDKEGDPWVDPGFSDPARGQGYRSPLDSPFPMNWLMLMGNRDGVFKRNRVLKLRNQWVPEGLLEVTP